MSRVSPLHCWAYLHERYSLAQFVPFHLLLVAAVGGVVRARGDVGWSAGHGVAHGALAGMLLLFYFVLRVMDEHKDREQDLIAYPERVLSRGLVTHGHLRGAAWIAVGVLIALAAPFGMAMLVGVALLLGYALLMLREFFAGAWLRERLVLYGISHTLVVLLSILVVALGFGLAAGRGPALLADPALLLAAMGLNGLVFSLEIARKVRMPEAERLEVDTYSKELGVRRAALLVPLVQAVSAAAFLPLALGWVRWSVLGLALLGSLATTLRFLHQPAARAAGRLVGPASASALLMFGVLASLVLL